MEPTITRASVVGLGRLGLPVAACLASRGISVIGVDTDPRAVKMLSGEEAPFWEPGLEDLLRDNSGRIEATGNLESAVAATEVTFIAVATPAEPDGTLSAFQLLRACEDVGKALQVKSSYHLVVVLSTAMPATMEGAVAPALEKTSGKRCGRDLGLCYSPPFIALGSVIHDFLQPEFILIGESDAAAGDRLEAFYRQVCERPAPAARMNFINAELTKLALNALITAKISQANTLARLCEKFPGADVDVVTAALGLDTRVGPKYLRGAISYGGPCFPRDNTAFAALAARVGAPGDIARATESLNRELILSLADFVVEQRPPRGQVGILGLAYKPDTDVTEESAGLRLACELGRRGLPVLVYDPAAGHSRPAKLCEGLTVAASGVECIQQSDVVVVATPWKEFGEIPAEIWGREGRPRVVIDCWRALAFLEKAAGVSYVALGRGRKPGARS